jgi:hypothetical protein
VSDYDRKMRDRYDELVEEHRTGDDFEMPVSVKLASGR